MLVPPRQTVKRTIVYPNGQRTEEEVDLLTDYSWRNFFSSINFVKIMQKLSKHRSHRIWLLVQYKSSVNIIFVTVPPLKSKTESLQGYFETNFESVTSVASAACSQTNQESSTLLWAKVETV